MILTDILITTVSSTGLVGIAAFLARNWISERLKQSIKHEYDLKLKDIENKYDKEQIEFKAFLEKDISVYKYKFEKSHEKTIEIIENVYSDIIHAHGLFDYFDETFSTITDRDKEKLLKEINDRIVNINNKMPLVLLYFGEECFHATTNAYGLLNDLYNMYMDYNTNMDKIKSKFKKSFSKMSELRILLHDVIIGQYSDK